MLIHDKVYSTFTIDSPIALELIHSKPFQRLKHISQLGLPGKYHYADGYSRYEHSIGVFILLNTLGTSEEEQIAGLLHDISHTAFSHVIDWVMGDTLIENYQDKRHLSVLRQPPINNILKKSKFSTEHIADLHRYTILERDVPSMCADRIDYVLRESSQCVIDKCLPFLRVYEQEIVFSDIQSARIFADNFLFIQENYWAGYDGITRYAIFTNMLKSAIDERIITLVDFDQTDDYVLHKITRSNNPKYLDILALLEKRDLSFLPKSSVPIVKKFRYVDPKVIVDGRAVMLSKISAEFRGEIERAKQRNLKGVYAGV